MSWWSCTAASADGVILMAAAGTSDGLIYKSTDSGVTWAATSSPQGGWKSISCSADGRVILAGPYGGPLQVSTNSGVTWRACFPPGGGYWLDVACSAAGDVLVAVGGSSEQEVWMSTDFGTSWALLTNAPLKPWSHVAVSENASHMALVAHFPAFEGPLYTSADYGTTWVSNSVPSANCGPIVCSADGSKLVMGGNGTIMTSTNFGGTWTTNNAPNNIRWKALAGSGDCTKLIATSGTQVYTAPPRGFPVGSVVSWSQGLNDLSAVPEQASNVVAIAASDYHTFAVRSDGVAFEWGAGSHILGQTNVPASLTNALNGSICEELGLAVREDGTVERWGWNANTVPTLSNITAVAAGPRFYSALRNDGVVVAWGDNSYGQTNVPAGLSNVVSLSAGAYHGLALKSDGTITAWGGNIGQNHIPEGLSNVVAVATGTYASLAVTRDGSLKAFPADKWPPIPQELSNVVAVSAASSTSSGFEHGLALTSDGSVWELGSTGSGMLSYKAGIGNIVQIASGAFHAVAVVGDGRPVVVRQPWRQVVYGTQPVSFSAGVVGAEPMSYQWQLNGTNIPAGTNFFLDIGAAWPTNAGNYTLIASNASGTTSSAAARLTVIADPPVISVHPSNQTVTEGATVTFTVAAAASPFATSYQWQRDSTNIPSATNAVLMLTNVQSADQGTYVAVASNLFGEVASSNAMLTVLEIGQALDAPELDWITAGDAGWFVQSATTHDGVSALRSGTISFGQQASLQTTVTGPGTITFWWQFGTGNRFEFSSSPIVAGLSVRSTAGWVSNTVYIGAGPQTLRWTFYRTSFSQSTAYLDEVLWTPGSTEAAIMSSPTSQSVPRGTNVSLQVVAQGTPPLSYQWKFNEIDLPGATDSTLLLLNVQATNSGVYGVEVKNDYGSATSSNATLVVRAPRFAPLQANSYLATDGFKLQLDGLTGHGEVTIYASTNLVDWHPIFTNSATTGSLPFTDTNALTVPLQFYRMTEE